jgi:hypothetical protein
MVDEDFIPFTICLMPMKLKKMKKWCMQKMHSLKLLGKGGFLEISYITELSYFLGPSPKIF